MTTLLLVDDDPAVHDSVQKPLRDVVERFLHATTPEEGLRLALAEIPDVILLDVNLPKIDGLKICALVRETAATRDIPVLFLTVESNLENLARAFEVGGTDYITKPFHEIELRARVKVALRTKRAFDLLKEQARIDGLTGLGNRAALEAGLESAVAAHERTGQPVSLLLLDLDRLKQVNDAYGHGVGDDLLRRLGACLRRGCRPYDLACRYGGDEFAVVLCQTEGRDARATAERLVASLRRVFVEVRGTRVPLRVSAGLATSAGRGGELSAKELLERADRALYGAKRSGGDRLVEPSEGAGTGAEA